VARVTSNFPERERERAASTEERPSLKCHKDDVEPKGGKCRSDGCASLNFKRTLLGQQQKQNPRANRESSRREGRERYTSARGCPNKALTLGRKAL
jgi:hypothetical protein